VYHVFHFLEMRHIRGIAMPRLAIEPGRREPVTGT
jgi:hypothetical protein